MLTVRLSWVMTGCGGKDTTRSRRSTRARTRSMNGTSSVRCPLTVRLYRPNRSITAASACGISATDFATTTMVNTTSAAKNSRTRVPPAPIDVPFSQLLDVPEYHCRGTVDVHDGHRLAGLVDVALVQRTRGPHLTVQLHLALMGGDPIEHQRLLALQRLDARLDVRTGRQPPP